MIDRAAKFAEQAHKGAHRKGTRIPYIVHPLETALIASMPVSYTHLTLPTTERV